MSSINTLVLCNANIPIHVLDEIIQNEVKKNREIKKDKVKSYDVISFHNISKIIADEVSLEQLHIKDEISTLLFLHKSINKIITIFPRHASSIRYEEFIKNINKNKLVYNFIFQTSKNNRNIIKFEKRGKKYDISCQPILNFICSDGRLNKIYNDSYHNPKNPIKTNSGYTIRLPGSTLWITMGNKRKRMIEIIVKFIKDHNIKKVLIDHHGPDCEAYEAYHQIENNDPERSKRQHRENIERVWDVLSQIIELEEIYARYLVLKSKKINDVLSYNVKEHSYHMQDDNPEHVCDNDNKKINIKKFKFIEKEKVLV